MLETANKQRMQRRTPWSFVVVGGVGLGAFAVLLVAWRGSPWALAAMTSRGFLVHAAVVVIGGVLLAGMLTVLVQAGAAARRARHGVRMGSNGDAILEFAMVLPILLYLLLLMVQSSLLMAAHLCVHYAAYSAARSAIVLVPDDLWGSNPEEQNVVYETRYSGKLDGIHEAAVWAVMPVSGYHRDLTDGGGDGHIVAGMDYLFGAYGKDAPSSVARLVPRKLDYAREYTEVDLALPVKGGIEYDDDEVLEVTVRHTFYLSIPYSDRLYALLDRDGMEIADGHYGIEITASCMLTNEGIRDVIEPPEFGEN